MKEREENRKRRAAKIVSDTAAKKKNPSESATDASEDNAEVQEKNSPFPLAVSTMEDDPLSLASPPSSSGQPRLPSAKMKKPSESASDDNTVSEDNAEVQENNSSFPLAVSTMEDDPLSLAPHPSPSGQPRLPSAPLRSPPPSPSDNYAGPPSLPLSPTRIPSFAPLDDAGSHPAEDDMIQFSPNHGPIVFDDDKDNATVNEQPIEERNQVCPCLFVDNTCCV